MNQFHLSANGVILTEGDDTGFLKPHFFQTVTDKKGEELVDWKADVSANSASDGKQAEGPSISTLEEKAEQLQL